MKGRLDADRLALAVGAYLALVDAAGELEEPFAELAEAFDLVLNETIFRGFSGPDFL